MINFWVFLALLAALGFLAVQGRALSPAFGLKRAVLKAVPTLALAMWLLLNPNFFPALWWMVAGLGLSAIGDFRLDLPDDKGFKSGLVAFLLGHIAYIGFLASNNNIGALELWQEIAVRVVVIACIFYLFWLMPSLPQELKAPIIAYTVVIAVMMAMAMMQGSGRGLLAFGAISFGLSDMLLAYLKFKKSLPFGKSLNWLLYMGGQFGLAFGAACAVTTSLVLVYG